jgi:capsular polysaccharide transport system permease protein
MKLFRSAMFWFFFLIPFTSGVTYFLFFASNQYEAVAHFTIEKNGDNQSDPLGALTGLPGSVASTRDALIIKDFIESREVIERTRDDFDIRKLYARTDKDWLSRLERDASIEDILEYWQKKVTVEFDQSSGIGILSVWAYEREQAVMISKAILKESELLVNNLSKKAREDSLIFAKQELAIAQANLKQARTDVRVFRDTEQALSPEKNAESKLKLVEHLEAERANAETELRSLRMSYPDVSPRVMEAKNKVVSLKKQVEKERQRSARITNASDAKTMSTIISKHEELLTEQGFAEKSYEAALFSIEKARIDATQQQRYLSVTVHPLTPEDPIRPKAPDDYLVLFLACLMLWGIMSLIIASIKDHAGWV